MINDWGIWINNHGLFVIIVTLVAIVVMLLRGR